MELGPHALVLLLAITAVASVAALVLTWSRKGRSEDEARAYLAGVSYVLEGDPDAAIAELSRAAQLNTQTLETYFALGALFRRKGELDRAVRLHQNMLLRPGLAPEVRRRAQLALATDYRRSGLAGRAQEVLEALLSEAPGHPEAAVELRKIHEEAGAWEQAAALQAKLLGAQGSEVETGGARVLAHHLAALARSAGEDPQGALALAEKATSIAPQVADAQLELGRARLALGDQPAAAAALLRALELEPELAPVSLELVAGAFEPAALERELVRLADGGGVRGAPYLLALALLHRRQGETEQAIAELNRLVDERPRFWEARKQLGALLLALDRSADLRAEYEEILGTLGQPPLGFSCRACRQQLLEHAFRCPACGAWDEVAREDAA